MAFPTSGYSVEHFQIAINVDGLPIGGSIILRIAVNNLSGTEQDKVKEAFEDAADAIKAKLETISGVNVSVASKICEGSQFIQ